MRCLSIMAIAVAVGFSLLGSATTAQTTDGTTAFNGNWEVTATGLHFRSGTYQLSEVNNVVIGVSTPEAGQAPAQINGKLEAAGLVEGNWRGQTGETGWFNMKLAPDGRSFSGQYGYNGRKPEGAIIGRLSTSAAASR